MTDFNTQHNWGVWFDIPVADLDRAIAFYQGVLATSIPRSDCHGTSYGVLEHDQGNGGCLVLDPDAVRSDGGVLVYLNAQGRIREALEQVCRLGGKILEPLNAIGEYGYRAIILDSEGNRIALYSAIESKS